MYESKNQRNVRSEPIGLGYHQEAEGVAAPPRDVESLMSEVGLHLMAVTRLQHEVAGKLRKPLTPLVFYFEVAKSNSNKHFELINVDTGDPQWFHEGLRELLRNAAQECAKHERVRYAIWLNCIREDKQLKLEALAVVTDAQEARYSFICRRNEWESIRLDMVREVERSVGVAAAATSGALTAHDSTVRKLIETVAEHISQSPLEQDEIGATDAMLTVEINRMLEKAAKEAVSLYSPIAHAGVRLGVTALVAHQYYLSVQLLDARERLSRSNLKLIGDERKRTERAVKQTRKDLEKMRAQKELSGARLRAAQLENKELKERLRLRVAAALPQNDVADDCLATALDALLE